MSESIGVVSELIGEYRSDRSDRSGIGAGRSDRRVSELVGAGRSGIGVIGEYRSWSEWLVFD